MLCSTELNNRIDKRPSGTWAAATLRSDATGPWIPTGAEKSIQLYVHPLCNNKISTLVVSS